jgi:hypothetical protein
MKAFSWSQALCFYVSIASLAGCGGGSQLGSNQPLIDRRAGAHAAPGRSWMASNLTKKDLLYVSNFYGSDVLVFTYPGGKNVGSISSDDPTGECTSTSNGNWWVVASGADEVLEYANGGTMPLKTLSVTGGEPSGCAVDPTTGDLAVINLGASDVVVFTGGSGSGTTIVDDLSSSYFDGYDNKGDLFVDGITPSDTYGVVELPKGSRTFETITLSQRLEFPGGIQWHDKYLAVGDQTAHVIYHFAIHGTHAKEIGATELGSSSDILPFYIQKPYVVGADEGNEEVEFWDYPAGGSPTKAITGIVPTGVIVSVGKKR